MNTIVSRSPAMCAAPYPSGSRTARAACARPLRDGDRPRHLRVNRAVVGERPPPTEASPEGLAGRQAVVPQARVRRRGVGPGAAVRPPDDGATNDREVPRTEREVDDPNADDLRRYPGSASPLVRA